MRIGQVLKRSDRAGCLENGRYSPPVPHLRFRAPGIPLDAAGLLALLPDLDDEPESVLRAGRLRRARVRGQDWQPGAPLRRARSRVVPGGAYCLEDAVAPALPELGRTAVALVPDWPWWDGQLARAAFGWSSAGGDGRVTRLSFEALGPEDLDAAAILTWAEAAGAPIVGALAHGGTACGGSLRFARPMEDGGPALDWPKVMISPPDFPDDGATLEISQETAYALRKGHPWVLPDDEMGDATRFAPGTLVRLAQRDRPAVGLARVSGSGRVAARMWATGEEGVNDPRGIEARVVDAVGRRSEWVAKAMHPDGTDVFRLVHGEADGLPGLAIDRVGPALRVLVSGPEALPLVERAWRTALGAAGLPDDTPVIEVLNLRVRPPGRHRAVHLIGGALTEEMAWVGREGGLRFGLDPGLADAERPRPGFGWFADQRENRKRVAARVEPGRRYANLFAHTGAFSLAMLEAGAGDVVSVDLSGPYLEQLERNLALSGLSGIAHSAVQRDVRQWLEDLGPNDRFDGIVLDPPTAAAAGRRFWSAHREMRGLLAGLIRRIEPGGFLLLARNEQRSRKPLRGWVEQAVRDAGRQLSALELAPPSADFPRMASFPEGTAFEGILAEVS